jgi:hypothetical protein
MRPYRGKRLDNGNWEEGWYIEVGGHSYIIPADATMYNGQLAEFQCEAPSDLLTDFIEVDPATVGQSIGLKDKNGKDLDWWKGDLFELFVGCSPFEIIYEQGCFVFISTSNRQFGRILCKDVTTWGELPKKIGNLHDKEAQ